MKSILTIIILFCALPIYGQWMQTGGPSAGNSSMAFNSKGDIFDLKNYFIRSTDNAKTWVVITPFFFTKFIRVINWGIARDNIYFFMGDGSFYRSTDNGNSWEKTFHTSSIGFSFYFSEEGTLYLYRYYNISDSGLLRSTDDGLSWVNLQSKLPTDQTNEWLSDTKTGELFIKGYQRNYIYFSTNKGDSWTKQSTLPYRLQTGIQSTGNGYLFCSNAILDSATDVLGGRMIRSKDNGRTWDSIYSPPLLKTIRLIITANDLLCMPFYDSIICTEDYGNKWESKYLPHTIFQEGEFDNIKSPSYTDLKENIYWSTFVSTTKYNWASSKLEELSIPIGSVEHIVINNQGKIFTQDNYMSISENGRVWRVREGFNIFSYYNSFKCLALDSSKEIIGICNRYFFRDNANSYDSTFLPDKSDYGFSYLLVSNNNNFFASRVNKIIRSTNFGTNWSEVIGIDTIQGPLTADVSGNIYAFSKSLIQISSDYGNSWKSFFDLGTINQDTISSLVITFKNEIFIGTKNSGVIHSTDFGKTWIPANENLGSAHITQLFASPDGSVAAFSKGGTLPDGIIYRPYGSNQWYSFNKGLRHTDDLTTMAFAPDGTAYLGTGGEGVWRYDGVFSSVTPSKPEDLSLSISPNPVSSNTTITYSLPKKTVVNLSVCDELGRTILPIVNGTLNSGEHTQNIDLHELPNGMYFVKLETVEGIITKKIILNK
jgi:photosystem II stability/assembly factor-like uncharacterized protein